MTRHDSMARSAAAAVLFDVSCEEAVEDVAAKVSEPGKRSPSLTMSLLRNEEGLEEETVPRSASAGVGEGKPHKRMWNKMMRLSEDLEDLELGKRHQTRRNPSPAHPAGMHRQNRAGRRRTKSLELMVVGGRHDYGSIHPSSSALTPARTSSMEDSDTFLQSRPLLQEDWRPVHPSRTGGVGGPSSTSLNGIVSGLHHHEGVEDDTATASTGFYRHHASTSSSGSLGAPGADAVGCGGSNGDLLMRSAETIRINIGTPTPPRFPKEKLKTLVAFLWMLLNFILTLTSLAITHERVPETAPLPDVVLDNIPTADWALSVSEAIIIVMVYSSFLAVILHKHRYIVLRRIFIMMGLLYMMRSLLYFVTTLPKPNPNYPCAPKTGNLTFGAVVRRVLKLMGGFGLSINGQHVYCGDYIYSGHTVALTMAYLVVREYTPRHWWLLHWTSLAASSVGIVMVLFARGHYTVDVLIAYYVTSRIFWIYHTMANNASLKEHGPSNYLTRLWWHSMFRYFEGNVGGPLPRHFQWPLPWPRCLQNKRPERTS